MFTGIPADRIDHFWPDMLPWIADACDRCRGRYTPDDILQAIKDRDMQAWGYFGESLEAVGVTEIVVYPRKKYCRILIGAGRDRKNWQHHIPDIERWARAQGCDGMETAARIGWWRAFYRSIDWERTHESLEKSFNKEG